MISKGLKHHAYLALRAVIEHHLDAAGRNTLNVLRLQLSFLGVDASEELVQVGVFKGLVAGDYDHLPEAAFYMVGNIDEAIEKAQKMAAEAA